MKVLSLFDGMACGAVAFTKMGIPIERYVAYEIDKYAVQVATHNFPYIEQRGDVFKADFTEFEGFDAVIGGSPCTYWSIAQKNNRETEASGLGWELFSQYVRAVKEAKPKFFLYENNKSMSKEIRASITETFGFEPICINSALVSAQNRQRLYWVGLKQADGTYRKADIEQPEDKGILLRDVLDSAYERCERIPEYQLDKSRPLTANYYKKACGEGSLVSDAFPDNPNKQVFDFVAEPVAVDLQVVGRKKNADGEYERSWEARTDGKSSNLTSVESRRMVAEPVRIGDLPNSDGHINGSQAMRIYAVDGKSVNLVAGGGGMGGKTGLYAIPSDEKTFPIYEVRNGLITIKDKQYPIKLADGFYIIRKLTVSECMRLQTVPEWYDFSVISNSQAYKCLGNGWSIDVIVHLIESAVKYVD